MATIRSRQKYNNSIKCINNANYYDLVEALVDFVNGTSGET